MFKKVLYPVDLQEDGFSHQTLPAVLAEVRRWKSSLHLLMVLPGFGTPLVASYFPPDAGKKALAKAKRAMKKYIADHVPDDIPVSSTVCDGTPYEEILRISAEQGSDLVIIPSHDRRGVERFLLGSTAAKVVSHAHCSVLVLRNLNLRASE